MMLGVMLVCWCATIVNDEAAIAARVAATLRAMNVLEKARALDIFKAADMLTNGAVDMDKAARTMGDLSAGVGVLHDV